jgi:AcrR family transcriptional regulator
MPRSGRRNSEAATPRRGRPPIPPDVQRHRLVEAARKALRQGDFGSVRVSDVVRAAGMSSRAFYEHFDSKEDLLLELIHETGRELLTRFEAIFAGGGSHVERVDLALEAYLSAFAGTPLDLEKLGESASGRVQQLLRHYVQEVGVRVLRQLEDVHREGVLPRPPDPVILEVLLLGLLGLASRYLAEGRAEELRSLRPRLRTFLVRVWS